MKFEHNLEIKKGIEDGSGLENEKADGLEIKQFLIERHGIHFNTEPLFYINPRNNELVLRLTGKRFKLEYDRYGHRISQDAYDAIMGKKKLEIKSSRQKDLDYFNEHFTLTPEQRDIVIESGIIPDDFCSAYINVIGCLKKRYDIHDFSVAEFVEYNRVVNEFPEFITIEEAPTYIRRYYTNIIKTKVVQFLVRPSDDGLLITSALKPCSKK